MKQEIEINRKLSVLEYIIDKCVDWYKYESGNQSDETIISSFTKIKILDILFFISVINAKPNKLGLLEVFNNYIYRPCGHIEKDLCENINNLIKYEFDDNFVMRRKPEPHIINYSISAIDKNNVDESINKLRKVNKHLVMWDEYNIINLHKLWYTWKTYKTLANKEGGDIHIPTGAILNVGHQFNF